MSDLHIITLDELTQQAAKKGYKVKGVIHYDTKQCTFVFSRYRVSPQGQAEVYKEGNINLKKTPQSISLRLVFDREEYKTKDDIVNNIFDLINKIKDDNIL